MSHQGNDIGTRLIESKSYGALEVTDNQIYHLELGVIGVSSIHEYALIPLEDTPFHLLHALNEDVSFITIPAYETVKDYHFEINDEVVELLQVQNPEEILVLLIVNIQEDQLYLNLKAPILLAPTSRQACQFIIHDQELPIRHLLQRKGE
ncbi:flagellar assembly protein FliW [Paenibacillus motobuensis]|uniref:flagellar assembly protein FliW n=1 Tax=Paenibacillus TaxID=44249 RepID=UPI0020416325|nr:MULTISPECIES: flagellar assembly protein FliW [Paenibacillus]MCM3040939.1 flagellar assembly protein FliW [Paenibacillus lutimineralis]MCM3648043.1 flagellar assembly protein FliW [Paenibacillus motobuensis]